MDGIQAIVPPDVGAELHIIRRLGWALMHQWDRVPADLQARLIEQAVFTQDRFQTAQLQEQITTFVRERSAAFNAQRT